MELINIYIGTEVRGKRPRTFLPHGTPETTIVCSREHTIDYENDRLIIPSVSDGPEFSAAAALLAARGGMFGMGVAAHEGTAPPPAPSPPTRKRKTNAKG